LGRVFEYDRKKSCPIGASVSVPCIMDSGLNLLDESLDTRTLRLDKRKNQWPVFDGDGNQGNPIHRN